MSAAREATPPAATETASPEVPPEQVAPGDAPVIFSPQDLVNTPATPDPPVAEPAGQALEGADSLRATVTEQSVTIGGIVDRLDSWGFTIADTRYSVWSALVVVLVISAVLLFARLANNSARSALRRLPRLSPSQVLLAEKVVTIAIWGMAILIGIDLLGVDLTALAVFSGAFGLAIGFGLQKTFGNLIAGIILLMDRSIKPGDVIAVTDMAGNETFGQIRKIGIRAVSIVTRDMKEYLIPNENLMVNQVENWSYSSRQVRVQVNVGVAYGADMTLAEKLMLEAANDCDRVLSTPPPTVWMSEYGESSVNFIIHCWIVDPEEGVGNVRSAVLKRLWTLLGEHEIEIPFPQRDINLRGNEQFDQLVAAIAQRVEGKSAPARREDSA